MEGKVADITISGIKGASPSETKVYVLILFDISNDKKRQMLVKTLKSYANRIQNSVFDAYLRRRQIRDLKKSLTRICANKTLDSQSDQIRIYEISSNCEMTVFGKCECVHTVFEDDVFI